MKLVKVRQLARGEKILCIPKELAEKINSEYMTIDVSDKGRIVYTPIERVRTNEAEAV